MGASCFSKPLFSIQRTSISVHPQPQQNSIENGGPQTTIPIQSLSSLADAQHMPPPKDHTPAPPKSPQIQPIQTTRVLTLKPAPERLMVSSLSTPSTSVNASATNVSQVSSPRTPVQPLTRRVSRFFSGRASVMEDSQSQSNKKQLHRNSTKMSLMRRRSKISSGKRSSIIRRPESPSASDSSSILGLDGVQGLYALASLTAYESKLVPDIWQACLDQNAYYCEHVLSRLLNRHPELEDMFKNATPREGQQCPISSKMSRNDSTSSSAREILQQKSEQVMAFFHRLIMIHELDYDRLSEECDRLGRSHAVYYYAQGLQPYHWEAFAASVMQEYKKTNMNIDLNTDEKELQQLAWNHFTTAVVSAVKEAFENEVQRMTPTSDNFAETGSTSAGDRNLFRF